MALYGSIYLVWVFLCLAGLQPGSPAGSHNHHAMPAHLNSRNDNSTNTHPRMVQWSSETYLGVPWQLPWMQHHKVDRGLVSEAE